MALLKCPKCGESFADSYKTCPFCAEDEEYYKGRLKKGNRRSDKRRRTPSILGPAMILVIFLILAFVLWIFFGEQIHDTVQQWISPQVEDQVDNTPVKPVEVEPISESFTLDVTTLTLAIGDTRQLNVSGAGECTWETDKSTVASVSDSGLVAAINEGTCVITVTDDAGNTANCTITVVKELEVETSDPVSETVDPSKVKVTANGHELPSSSESGYTYDVSLGNKESLTLAIEGTTVTPVWHVDIGGTVVSVKGNTIIADQGKGSGHWSTLTCTLGDLSIKIKVHIR